jgi:hypothetical protein
MYLHSALMGKDRWYLKSLSCGRIVSDTRYRVPRAIFSRAKVHVQTMHVCRHRRVSKSCNFTTQFYGLRSIYTYLELGGQSILRLL